MVRGMMAWAKTMHCDSFPDREREEEASNKNDSNQTVLVLFCVFVSTRRHYQTGVDVGMRRHWQPNSLTGSLLYQWLLLET